MPWGFAAAAVGSVVSGAISSGAAGDAADTQAAAGDRSAQLQDKQFQQTRADLEPYRTAGYSALDEFTSLLGLPARPGSTVGTKTPADVSSWLTQQPGYKFQMDQALKGVTNNASARSTLRSGATLKALTDRAGDVASTSFGDNLNRLAALAGVGQSAVNTGGALGADAAKSIGSAYENAGAARASGYASTANIWNRSIEGLNSTVMTAADLKRQGYL